MSSSGVLIALLALAYLGSLGANNTTGRALPARWSLYLVVGLVIGPATFGLLQASALRDFSVIGQVGAAWLALVTGLSFDFTQPRSVRRAAAGVTITAFAAAALGAAAWYGAVRFLGFTGGEALLLGAGVGILLAPSATLCLEARAYREDAPKPVSETLCDVSRSSALVPAFAAAALLAVAPNHGLVSYSLTARVLVTLGTGVVLGLLAVALLGREFRRAESWGLLLGLTLLGSGAANRVGLSAVVVAFTLGLTIALVSRHRADIRAMTVPTESSVLLPVALLVGAALKPDVRWLLPVLVLCSLRLVVDWLRGNVLRWLLPSTRPGGYGLGLALSMPGAMLLALTVELTDKLPGEVAQGLLVASVAAGLTADVVASMQLKRSLLAAGEFERQSTRPSSPTAPSEPESVRS